jgi:hypothetical protein
MHIIETKRRTYLAAMTLVVVFLAGMMAGYAMHGSRPPEQRRVQRRVAIGEPLSLDSLSLSADQRRRADSIIAAIQPATDSIINALVPRVRMLTDSVDRALREILTPSQRERLDALRRARRDSMP